MSKRQSNYTAGIQKTMVSWKMSNKAVIVYCDNFVFSAVGLFLALMIIGLVILFRIGKNMAGVDRSNILIFLLDSGCFRYHAS